MEHVEGKKAADDTVHEVTGKTVMPGVRAVEAGSVCRSSSLGWKKKTEIELNPTAKDRTTSCRCTNSEIFQLPVKMFVEKSKNQKKTGLSSSHVLELTHAHFP